MAPKEISSEVKKRGISIRKITLILKKLKGLHLQSNITDTFCRKQLALVESEIIVVKVIDETINKIMLDNGYLDKECDAELNSQANYHLNLSLELDEFEDYLVVKREDLTATNKLVYLLSKLDGSN